MPTLPGGAAERKAALRSLLEALSPSLDIDANINWPNKENSKTVRDAIRDLRACGLIDVTGRTVSPSAWGREWLEGREDDLLAFILHAHIRFVGDLLWELGEAPLTATDILSVANEKYGFTWKTKDQVARRTAWLKATNHLEITYDNNYVLTESGSALRERLPRAVLDEPDLHRAATELRPAHPAVSDLLTNLGERLPTRRPLIGYLPRLKDGDIVASMHSLIDGFAPSLSRQEFVDHCRNVFGSKESSANSALQSATVVGLIRRTGSDSYESTAAARGWLESGDPLDLIRIVHAHVQCVAEVLLLVDQADTAPALTDLATSAFGLSNMNVGDMRTRLHLLHAAGLLRDVGWARYALTPLGSAFFDQVAIAQPLTADEQSASTGEAGDSSSGVRTQLHEVAARLVESARDSSSPQRLEVATRDAFRLLGFSAEHIGGPGKTDVLVELDQDSRRATVDAKSAGSGKVDEGAVDFTTLDEHRVKHAAQAAALVGPSFASRIVERARAAGVALIEADTLAEVLRQHAGAPLPPVIYAGLLFGTASAAATDIREARENFVRQQDLLRGVLQVLAREAVEVDAVLGGTLTARDVYLMLRADLRVQPTLEAVEDVLRFLASPLIRAVTVLKEQRGSSYRSVEDPATTALRIKALAAAVEGVTERAVEA